MSESLRLSVQSIQIRSVLLIVLVLFSSSSLYAQKTVPSSRIDTITSIFRNSTARTSFALQRLSLLTVLPRSLRVYSGEGGTAEIVIISNTDWVLKCTDKWISADTQTGGGYNKVILTVKENSETFERIAKITVAAVGLPVRIIELSQKARHDE